MRERFRSGVDRSHLWTAMAIVVGFGGSSYAAVQLAGWDTDGSSPISVSELVRPFVEPERSPGSEAQPDIRALRLSARPSAPASLGSESVRAVVAPSGQIVSGGENIYSVSHAVWAGGPVPGVHAFVTTVVPHKVAAELTPQSKDGDITADVRSELIRNDDGRTVVHTIIVRTYDRAGRLANRPFSLRIN